MIKRHGTAPRRRPRRSPQTRPARGEELELEIDSLAHGGRGVARATATSSSSRGRCRAIGFAPASEVEAQFGEATAVELVRPGARSDRRRLRPRRRAVPRCPWQEPSLRAPARREGDSQVDDALRRLGGLDAFELEPIEAAPSSLALPQQARVLIRRAGRSPALGFHPRGSWAEVIDVDDCHARLRAHNAARNLRPRLGAVAKGIPAVRTRASVRGCCAIWWFAIGATPGSSRRGSSPRPLPSPSPPVDLHTVVDGPGSGTDGPTGVLGEEHLEEEVRGPRASGSSTSAFFQTNTATGETHLRRSPSSYAGLSGTRAGLRPLLRESARSPWRSRATPARSGGSRSVRRRSATPSTTRDATGSPTPISSRPRRRLGLRHCSSGPVAPTWSSSTRRAPASRRRWFGGSSSAGRRGSSTSPATRRRSPRTRPSSRRRLYAPAGPARRHVPADPARRVRGLAREVSPERGLGVAAGLDPEIATPLADRCEALGYSSMWSNDHPGANGLDTLAAFAEGSEQLELGVAVMALDRHQPAQINQRIERLGLDRQRLRIGLGAGFSERPLTTMRNAIGTLREALPGVRLVLAAMGPRMCALAGSDFDGAFFNWMTPGFAAGARDPVHAGAREAGREPPPVLGYVRTAAGPDAAERPGQGGVLLPRSARRLSKPLRPPPRAPGHRRRRRRRPRGGSSGALPLLAARRGGGAKPGERRAREDGGAVREQQANWSSTSSTWISSGWSSRSIFLVEHLEASRNLSSVCQSSDSSMSGTHRASIVGVKRCTSPNRASSVLARGTSISLRVSRARSPIATIRRGCTIASSSTMRSTHSPPASDGSETGHLTHSVP